MTNPDGPERDSLGPEIRRLRLTAGLTLKELSTLTGIREPYLAAIEDGREEPSAPALERIARHLEAVGGSFEALAGLLTQTELNPAGEYAQIGQKPNHAPALSHDGRRIAGAATPIDNIKAAADAWRRKTDVEVADALRCLDQYSDEGRQIILEEAERRNRRTVAAPGFSSAPDTSIDNLDLERAEFAGGPDRTPCAICHGPLFDSYFQINGATICSGCCEQVRTRLTAGSPLSRSVRATGAGLVAAAAGTILYYAILAISGYELSLISIVVGVGVGKAVSWGSYGRGGWKYQALAMALTYLAIVTSYVPMIVKELDKNSRAASGNMNPGVESGRERPDTQSHASRGVTTTSGPVSKGSSRAVTLGGALLALFLLLVLACAVPFFAGVSNLIGLVIIGIGVYQAWKLNRRRAVVISGPHPLMKPQESPAVV